MSRPYWVLDTGALMAYAHGVPAVGEALVEVADAVGLVEVPLVCLLEAYSLLDHTEHEYLAMLRRNDTVRVTSPALRVDQADDCPMIGGLARHTGRLGAGHAAYTALASGAGVVTSRADQIRKVLGEGWPILEV
ncbi:hypothetical protein CA850_03935 [Micromonospora echinospora]|uniref:PIN domain-containing protein n=1 Tax=Micromonospora echinospora TaxID=1877 RepID=A0A1C5A048_MICEC|nr:hypothetical protein [Micromonospora echinospora]OZV83809.1 hypothetical protein CA850_03935 [Micromonospora echinospora]SCF38587.1 hypothetical protein GA0070618_6058 [Micromonospora echinospora]